MRQPIGDARGVAGGQDQVAEPGSLALGQPPRALGQHPASNAARQAAERARAGEAAAGDRTMLGGIIRHAPT